MFNKGLKMIQNAQFYRHLRDQSNVTISGLHDKTLTKMTLKVIEYLITHAAEQEKSYAEYSFCDAVNQNKYKLEVMARVESILRQLNFSTVLTDTKLIISWDN